MGQATHEQTNLLLRLYELRREPRLREARKFFLDQLDTSSPEAMQRQCPPGSENSASLRMTLSYWDMCAGIVNRGLIDEEFFFENTGEQMIVFEKMRALMPGFREMFKNPFFLAPLEEHVNRLIAWREKRAPGSTEALKQFVAQAAQAARSATQAAGR